MPEVMVREAVKLPPEAAPLKSYVAARDGIAVVLNPANTVQGLTLDQVRGIFSGTIKNWKEVGGSDHAIAVISREAGSGTRSSASVCPPRIRCVASSAAWMR